MAQLLRKILPVVPLRSKPYDDDEDDKNNPEYSFAVEYSGPPISSDIPLASPIVVDQIPIAVTVASPSLLRDRSLPVIQPTEKSTPGGRRRLKEPELSSEPTLRSNSLTNPGASLTGPNVSCESQSLVDSSGDVGCATGDYSQPKSVNGVRSSSKFRSPDAQDNSSDVIRSSAKLNSLDRHDNLCVILKLSDGSEEGADAGLQNGINPANLDLTDSGLSSHEHTSKFFSCNEGYFGDEETPSNVRGSSVVISDDPETSDIVHEESDNSESVHVRAKAERYGKKSSCCQCLQEYQSLEMEVCIVCDTMYCCNCVVRAMGSTPEGRKCFSCVDSRLDVCMPMSSNGVGSSGKSNSLNCHDNMPANNELPDNRNDGANAGFHDYMNPANSESTESDVSSYSVSSEVFSCKEEGFNNEETPGHVRRPSVVTFRDPDPSDTVYEESDYSEVESIHERPKAVRPGKKGSCYRCLKGNRFTEKDFCIVCGAKYCSNCVLKAMRSMPEGRKCVTCIGFSVDDSKRRNLGKCSRMLKRLLTETEVKQIMRSEISCEANQLPPERVFVNGEPLSQKELVILLSCPNPPKNLNPGTYWYDKVLGFWGEEGHRPCQIISPQMNVGGQIMKNASNGNTNVMINNREITRRELWMLKLAGVQCEGQPHFWVSTDGSYLEERMRDIKGRIWDKSTIKLVCALLSLPTPPDSENPHGNEVNGVNPCEQQRLIKLFLLGEHKSGTSTIYKQPACVVILLLVLSFLGLQDFKRKDVVDHAKLLFKVPFSEEERQNIKFMIQSNLYFYIGILLEGRERFEEESLFGKGKRQVIDEPGQIDDKMMYSISPRLKSFSDWLLKVMASGNLEAIFPAATREYAPFIEELWRDAGFQATYNRRNELDMLPRHATYFLERTGYEPSDMDILYAEGITSSNGLSSMVFSLPEQTQENSISDSSNQNDPLLSYQLIRVHPRSLGENCKWLQMFEDVDMILFCVSLTDYDEYFEDSKGFLTNKMLASRQLFQNIVIHPTFNQKNFLLILNKYDMFGEKIEEVPLSRCEWFEDFNPAIEVFYHSTGRRNNNAPLALYAAHYIAEKFKRLFDSLTGRKLFVSVVTALEPETVHEALKYAKEILKWDEEEPFYTNIESTDYEESTDDEASSPS
ncbi:Extra-large guanine nucleotide-binding protein 1 [Citrus sinensis]|nr:Extra-large guanine nucleotide-binding protein 1 [Citrus sinensis]